MISHNSRRDSGSTPTVGSSSSSSAGERDQRAGEAELLLHAAGQATGQARGEGTECCHLHRARDSAGRARLCRCRADRHRDRDFPARSDLRRDRISAACSRCGLAPACGSRPTSIPSTVSVPASAVISPAISRMSVVLPAPSGPTKRGERTRPDVERYVVERFDDLAGLAAKALAQIARMDGRRGVARGVHEALLPAGVASGVRRQEHRCRHAETQLIARVLDEHPDLVDEAGAQFLGLHCLRRELCDR